MPYVEFLAGHHDRATFDCGKEPLNRYLREVARQNPDRDVGVTRVVVPERGSAKIMGYFTLLTRTVDAQVIPEKRLPRGQIGVVLLGRLALDKRFQAQGLGKRMLLRAMAETEMASRHVGIHSLLPDAIDEAARGWYLGLEFGFAPVINDPDRLYVPMTWIRSYGIAINADEL